MRRDGRGSQTSTTWILGRLRRRRTVLFRSLLLSVAVFTIAAATGALLAGSAPTSPAEAPEDAARSSAYEQVFAESMVYSGTAALTLSVTGLVMVGRRRRFW